MARSRAAIVLRTAAVVIAAGALTLLGAVPVVARPACSPQIAPPPPVDSSEAPAPGTLAPPPLAVPDPPVGGLRMGECGLVLPAGAPAPPTGISSTSWLIADADSGAVLAARDPHARNRPASTLKLLIALLVADQLPPDRVVVATEADTDEDGSRVGVGPGGRYTVRQLLTGLLLASGNDAAHALAVQLGGVRQTLEQMNELAARLGARDTRAATPSGLDGVGMSASAYDLALAFRQVLRRPLLAELLGTRQTDFPGYGNRPGFVVSNDNKLLRTYPGALGGKTGFTDDARHTQLDAAQRGGRRLMVVLMRGEQRPVSMSEQAARLLDYGFALPPGSSVGRLVDQAQGNQAQSPQTAEAAPVAGVPAASRGWIGGSSDAARLTPVVLWVGVAFTVLVVLGALVARQRYR
ncbi:MAG: D-alanyl-D-alanine carboxypeptidase [Pseudonocardiales bacterium]|nr:D-alanyl-D-alanine carboxypeptidase [Pseudonocardiales bacterium]